MKSRSAHNEFTPLVTFELSAAEPAVTTVVAVEVAAIDDELSAVCRYSSQGVFVAAAGPTPMPTPVEAVAAVTTVAGRYKVPGWSVLRRVCVLSSSLVQSHMVSLPRRRPWM